MRNRFLNFALAVLSITVVLDLPNSTLGQSTSRGTVAAVGPIRDWQDASGHHSIKASFMGVIDRSKVALKTAEGKEITIELSRLSNADIYEAVKSDLLKKMDLVSQTAPAPRGSAPRANTRSRNARPANARRAQALFPQAQPAKVRSVTAPVAKPGPTINDSFKERIDQMIATVEDEDSANVFQAILHPKEYKAFSASPRFKDGLKKFEGEKRGRLLSALRSIKYESAQKKPGGKIQFETDSAPISFKNVKGTWYLNN